MMLKLRTAIKNPKQLVNFWVSLAGPASITAILWYFYPIGDLYSKIVLPLLAAFMSLLYLLDGLSKDKVRVKFSWEVGWFAAISLGVLLIAFGAWINAPYVVINVASLLAAALPLLLYCKIAEGERLLKIWLIPIIVSASLYLVPPITSDGATAEFLLVPLPVVSYACIPWVLAAKLSLTHTRLWQKRAILGSGMQSLTMLLLVAPLVALTILAVNALEFDDVWVAVSAVLVSILFGSTISVPFRKFILDLGDLSQNTKRECADKTCECANKTI